MILRAKIKKPLAVDQKLSQLLSFHKNNITKKWFTKSIFLFMHVRLSVRLSVSYQNIISVCLSFSFIFMSVCLSVCLLVSYLWMFVCLSVCQFHIYKCLSVCLSVSFIFINVCFCHINDSTALFSLNQTHQDFYVRWTCKRQVSSKIR